MSAEQLRAVFAADGGGGEPLDNPELTPKFEALLGSGTKPFECVGEVNECRAAVVLAARPAGPGRDPAPAEAGGGDQRPARRADRSRDRGHAPPGRRELRARRAGRRVVLTRHGNRNQQPATEPAADARLVRPARRAGGRLGARPRGQRVAPQAARARRRAGPGRRQPNRAGRPRDRRRRPGRPGRLRDRHQDPGHQPLRTRGGRSPPGRGHPGRRARPVAAGSRPEPGRLRHRDQGQVDHLVHHRPPAGRPRLPGAGRRQLRRRPLRPAARRRLRLLGDRGIQLHRRSTWPARRRSPR